MNLLGDSQESASELTSLLGTTVSPDVTVQVTDFREEMCFIEAATLHNSPQE
jgi:hypothetical protein